MLGQKRTFSQTGIKEAEFLTAQDLSNKFSSKADIYKYLTLQGKLFLKFLLSFKVN